jgi:hypothetical protein
VAEASAGYAIAAHETTGGRAGGRADSQSQGSSEGAGGEGRGHGAVGTSIHTHIVVTIQESETTQRVPVQLSR